jgi:aromatic-L-amino-acid decarboxylase
VHVDAAYAGSAALLPEQQHHFAGLAAVDSYSFNPHKWLLVNFDCCAMWVADQAPLKRALSLTPVFLQGTGNVLDYKVGPSALGWAALRWAGLGCAGLGG